MSLFKICCGLVFTILSSHVAFAAPVTFPDGEEPSRRGGLRPGREWGAEADGTKVYHQAKVDSQGRSLVFKYDVARQAMVYGHVEGRQIVWHNDGYSPSAAKPHALELEGRRAYYPASQYPEVQSDKRALPRSQSLVIQEGDKGRLQHHSPRGSGQAELTNRYAERLIQMRSLEELKGRGLDERFRPSRLARASKATESTRAWMKAEIGKLIAGKPNAIAGDAVTSGQLPEPVKKGIRTGPMIEMGQATGAVYIALGMMAGAMLYADYADNPAAWSAYVSTATDPSTLAQIVAFMGVYQGTYYGSQRLTNKIFGEGTSNKAGVRSVLYGGAMLSAVFATTVMSEMMADPNSGKCIGITAYKETGVWTRDIAACDAFWETWKSNPRWNKLASEQLMPMFANIMVAGGLLKAMDMGISYLVSKRFVATALERVAFGFNAKAGPWVTIGSYAVRIALFFGAYQISDQVFGVGQKTREFFAADWSFSNDPLGKSISHVEENLLTEWSRLKASDFVPYVVPPGKIEAENKSYADLVEKYAGMQDSWRGLQMSDTQAALQQWSTKVFNYYAMLEVANDFYKTVAQMLADQQNILDPEERQKAGINQAFLDAYEKRMDAQGSQPWKTVKTLNLYGHWKHVQTYKVTDYLITSMACGPEAEGYKDDRNSIVAAVVDSWRWLNGNTNPTEVIENGDDGWLSQGWSMTFNPPRIVRALDGAGYSVCQGGGSYLPFGTGPKIGHRPQIFSVSTDRGRYNNLFEYINAEVRPQFIDNGNNQFQTWWTRAIAAKTIEIEKFLRKDYEVVLNTHFKTALTKKDYYHCSPGSVALPDLESVMRAFSLGDEVCPADATHRLSRGILNNLRDEMRLYMSLATDMYESNRTRIGPPDLGAETGPNADLRANYVYMMSLFDQVLKGATEINKANRPDVEALKAEFTQYSMAVKLYLLAPVMEKPAFAVDLENEVRALQEQSRALLPEMTQVYKTEGESSPRLRELREKAQALGRLIEPKIKSLEELEVVLRPNKGLEEWAFTLGNRMEGTFKKAEQLYSTLTTFEAK